MALADIINQIRNRSQRDQQRLKEFFTNSLGSAGETESVFTDVSEQKHKDGYTCTHCQSTNVIRFGEYQVKITINTIERQRYRCKECGKTFTDMTNTPLHRTHMPSEWLQFNECMIEGYFLYSEKGKRNIQGRKPRLRGGSSEFRGISKDQVCVLVARDRQKRTFSKTVGKGRIIKKSLDEALGSKLSIQNVLCTDAWRAFMTYAKEKGIEHHRFKANGRERVKGIYHIQNVNSYHSRLKSWIERFNGIATKYLDHYLSWFQFLDAIKHIKDNFTVTKMVLDSCSFSVNTTYDKLRLSEFSK